MDIKQYQTEATQLVTHSANLGVKIVKQIAAEVLRKQPAMSLRQFMVVLDQYENNAHKINPNSLHKEN